MQTRGLVLAMLAGFVGAGLWDQITDHVLAQDKVPRVIRAERIELIAPDGSKSMSLIGHTLITKGLILAGGEEPGLIMSGPENTELSLTTGENKLGLTVRDNTGPRVVVALAASTGVVALYDKGSLSWVAGRDR